MINVQRFNYRDVISTGFIHAENWRTFVDNYLRLTNEKTKHLFGCKKYWL